MSDMADVLAGHQFMYHSFNGVTQKRYLACSCGEMPLAGDHPTHLAAALSAAGFGPVADEKRCLELAALLAYDAVEESALQQARAEAWELGVIHGHNTEGRLIDKRESNPYREASNDDQ